MSGAAGDAVDDGVLGGKGGLERGEGGVVCGFVVDDDVVVGRGRGGRRVGGGWAGDEGYGGGRG